MGIPVNYKTSDLREMKKMQFVIRLPYPKVMLKISLEEDFRKKTVDLSEIVRRQELKRQAEKDLDKIKEKILIF